MRTLLMLALFMLAACDNSQERLASLKKTFPTNSTCSMNPKISQVVINGVTQEQKSSDLPYCKFTDDRGLVEAWYLTNGIEAHLKIDRNAKGEWDEGPNAPTLRNQVLVPIMTSFASYNAGEMRGCLNLAHEPGDPFMTMVNKPGRNVRCNRKGLEYWARVTDK